MKRCSVQIRRSWRIGIHAGADSFIKARLESGNSYYLKIDGPAAEYTVSMTAETTFRQTPRRRMAAMRS